MKKGIFVILFLFVIVLFSGCSPQNYSLSQSQTRIAQEEVGGEYKIYIDTDNGVMYLIHKSGYGESMTVMFESDGNIKVHPDYK